MVMKDVWMKLCFCSIGRLVVLETDHLAALWLKGGAGVVD